jgi:hypothetical protein
MGAWSEDFKSPQYLQVPYIINVFNSFFICLYQRFSNCGARPQGALLVPSGGAICLYEEHIYFERNMGAT